MVGDTQIDFEGAGEAGVRFIGRVPPGGDSPFLAETPVISDFCNFAFLLEEWNSCNSL